jgi:hypothetical protein
VFLNILWIGKEKTDKEGMVCIENRKHLKNWHKGTPQDPFLPYNTLIHTEELSND